MPESPNVTNELYELFLDEETSSEFVTIVCDEVVSIREFLEDPGNGYKPFNPLVVHAMDYPSTGDETELELPVNLPAGTYVLRFYGETFTGVALAVRGVNLLHLTKVSLGKPASGGAGVDEAELIHRDGSVPWIANQSVGDNKLTDLADPADDQDAVNLRTLQQSIEDELRPFASAGADRQVARNTVVILDGTGSSAAPGRTLTYQWRQVSGPEITLDDPTLESPRFTIPNLFELFEFVFGLTVNDGFKDSREDAVTISMADALALQHEVAGTQNAGYAEIVWETDAAATAQVFWGTDPGALSPTSEDEDLEYFHYVTLAPIGVDTTYYFKVRSTRVVEGDTETVDSPVMSFTSGKERSVEMIVLQYSISFSQVTMDRSLSRQGPSPETEIETSVDSPEGEGAVAYDTSLAKPTMDHAPAARVATISMDYNYTVG